MGQRFQHPSAELPPFAPFALELPDGWRVDEAPDCLGVWFDPASQDFLVNLLVSADRLSVAADLEAVAQSTLADMAGTYPGFAVESEKVGEIGGRPASLRVQSFDMESAPGRITQLQVLFFNPPDGRGKTHDLFHLDGSCLARDADTYIPLFLEIADSFQFLD